MSKRFLGRTSNDEALADEVGGSGATGAGPDRIFLETDQTMTSSYTITSTKNAVTVGTLTINTGVTLTIPTGVRLVIV